MVVSRESDTMIKTVFMCSVCIQAIARVVERPGSPVKWNKKVMDYRAVPMPEEEPDQEQVSKLHENFEQKLEEPQDTDDGGGGEK